MFTLVANNYYTNKINKGDYHRTYYRKRNHCNILRASPSLMSDHSCNSEYEYELDRY